MPGASNDGQRLDGRYGCHCKHVDSLDKRVIELERRAAISEAQANAVHAQAAGAASLPPPVPDAWARWGAQS